MFQQSSVLVNSEPSRAREQAGVASLRAKCPLPDGRGSDRRQALPVPSHRIGLMSQRLAGVPQEK